ncbi:MAG: hydroxylamine reductase [Spirochaetes bacterium GWF1_41_5]|nr:MAG: hydroxylamine reductase [Spirochaetes bacterium GWF1_41_5]
MSMFCYQCQEAAKNQGCTVKGVCGKDERISNLQDLLLYNLKGISEIITTGKNYEVNYNDSDSRVNNFITESLFSTITNANFDEHYFIRQIAASFALKTEVLKYIADGISKKSGADIHDELHPAALLQIENTTGYHEKLEEIGILSEKNEDIRSLRELLIYGLKGIAAYKYHAGALGYKDESIDSFIIEGLAATLDSRKNSDELVNLNLQCGKNGVAVMALLDKANTERFGVPVPSEVNLGVGLNPGILISGHDLKDMDELLKQTENTGIDIYTHGEMLPAHYYPSFKKYRHLKGNYGGAWWKQHEEFEKFNGPVLMTTNCIIPPGEAYRSRLFTTGPAGFEGVTHIADRKDNSGKDFSALIALAKKCPPPQKIESGKITGGFAHGYTLSIADKILAAVKTGAIKKFIVMAGCDGRHKTREYYTEFSKMLPGDTVILTAGCAKYRYNKLDLGQIGGIPRVLDAGQCNDSYSLAIIALKLAEALKVNVNDLPIVYNIAWYEQKAVIVLLALLYLGIKNIHLGPSLPAFLSPKVAEVLVKSFGIAGINNAETDVRSFME